VIEGNDDGPREGLNDGEVLGASLGISERIAVGSSLLKTEDGRLLGRDDRAILGAVERPGDGLVLGTELGIALGK